jgi:hypothetical protein
MKDPFVDNFVIFEYTILHCRALCICTWCNQMHVSFFSRSFLTMAIHLCEYVLTTLQRNISKVLNVFFFVVLGMCKNTEVYVDFCWKKKCCVNILMKSHCNQMHVSFFSRSFLTIIESILGQIQIITPHQTMFFIYF